MTPLEALQHKGEPMSAGVALQALNRMVDAAMDAGRTPLYQLLGRETRSNIAQLLKAEFVGADTFCGLPCRTWNREGVCLVCAPL